MITWGLRAVKGGRATGRHSTLAPFGVVATRFGLAPLETRILQLTYAAERSLAVAQAARARAGEFSVELLREVLDDDEVDGCLAAGRALRRHALVELNHGGAPRATDRIQLGAGLAGRLTAVPDVEGLGPGVHRLDRAALPTWATLTPSPRVLALVPTLLGSVDPRLVILEGCGRRDAIGLAAALAQAHSPGVLAVDAEALVAAGAPWRALAALRREADLDGRVLLVYASAALGEGWRALAAPAPAAPLAPPLVVLADTQPREVVALDTLRPVVLSCSATDLEAATAAARAISKDDGFDHIRQLAIRDAERALGIVRPATSPEWTATSREPTATSRERTTTSREPAATSPEPTATSPERASTASLAPTAGAHHFTVPAQASASTVPAQASAATVPAQASAPSGQETGSRSPDPSATATGSALPPAPSEVAVRQSTQRPVRRSRKGQAHFGNPAAPPPTASAPPAAPATVAEERGGELPADATVAEIARACSTSPDPQQRIALIRRLRGVKSSAAIAALRANVQSAHPGVRGAAEAAMEALFGPHWSRSRPVPKPVQTSPADDKDRGPPGGW